MGGRGSSNPNGGGSGSGASSRRKQAFTAAAAAKAIKTDTNKFAEGEAPNSITVNGVKLTGGQNGTYESVGGYTVRTYKYYVADKANASGIDGIYFKATGYKAKNGKKVKGHERQKSKVFDVQIMRGRGYSTGRSGGI